MMQGSLPCPRAPMDSRPVAAGDVTLMLERWQAGDEAALDALLPLVYDEIRSLADRHLRRRGGRCTLQPTELAHEVLLRFLGCGARAKDRLHFFSLTAHAMRNILVDRFRRRAAGKRGNDPTMVTLETGLADLDPVSIDLIDLDRALARFAEISPRAARMVELRYFAGLTNEEISGVLDVSPATVTREWRAARLWLADALAAPAQPA